MSFWSLGLSGASPHSLGGGSMGNLPMAAGKLLWDLPATSFDHPCLWLDELKGRKTISQKFLEFSESIVFQPLIAIPLGTNDKKEKSSLSLDLLRGWGNTDEAKDTFFMETSSFYSLSFQNGTFWVVSWPLLICVIQLVWILKIGVSHCRISGPTKVVDFEVQSVHTRTYCALFQYWRWMLYGNTSFRQMLVERALQLIHSLVTRVPPRRRKAPLSAAARHQNQSPIWGLTLFPVIS